MVATGSAKPHDAGRRAVLRGWSNPSPALRPPWTWEVGRFTEDCTGCERCVEACPEHVLVPGEGRLPQFDPGRGECTFCGDCAAACPEQLFSDPRASVPWNLHARIGQSCLALQGVVCSGCRDACGEAAILFPLNAAVPLPQVRADRCTGCGACVAGCPVRAIHLSQAVIEEVVDA